jgi:hypothetical protein
MVLGNRYNISPPGQGVWLPPGQSSSCHNHKVDRGLSSSCLTSGWHAVIVWFEVYIFGNVMKVHCYNIHEIKLSGCCTPVYFSLQYAIISMYITVHISNTWT